MTTNKTDNDLTSSINLSSSRAIIEGSKVGHTSRFIKENKTIQRNTMLKIIPPKDLYNIDHLFTIPKTVDKTGSTGTGSSLAASKGENAGHASLPVAPSNKTVAPGVNKSDMLKPSLKRKTLSYAEMQQLDEAWDQQEAEERKKPKGIWVVKKRSPADEAKKVQVKVNKNKNKNKIFKIKTAAGHSAAPAKQPTPGHSAGVPISKEVSQGMTTKQEVIKVTSKEAETILHPHALKQEVVGSVIELKWDIKPLPKRQLTTIGMPPKQAASEMIAASDAPKVQVPKTPAEVKVSTVSGAVTKKSNKVIAPKPALTEAQQENLNKQRKAKAARNKKARNRKKAEAAKAAHNSGVAPVTPAAPEQESKVQEAKADEIPQVIAAMNDEVVIDVMPEVEPIDDVVVDIVTDENEEADKLIEPALKACAALGNSGMKKYSYKVEEELDNASTAVIWRNEIYERAVDMVPDVYWVLFFVFYFMAVGAKVFLVSLVIALALWTFYVQTRKVRKYYKITKYTVRRTDLPSSLEGEQLDERPILYQNVEAKKLPYFLVWRHEKYSYIEAVEHDRYTHLFWPKYDVVKLERTEPKIRTMHVDMELATQLITSRNVLRIINNRNIMEKIAHTSALQQYINAHRVDPLTADVINDTCTMSVAIVFHHRSRTIGEGIYDQAFPDGEVALVNPAPPDVYSSTRPGYLAALERKFSMVTESVKYLCQLTPIPVTFTIPRPSFSICTTISAVSQWGYARVPHLRLPCRKRTLIILIIFCLVCRNAWLLSL